MELPDAGLNGQFLQGWIGENASVPAFDNRCLARRTQCHELLSARIRFRIEPGEWHKVLVQKLSDGVRVAAMTRADDAQAERAHLRQQLPSTSESDDQLLTQARHAIEQRPELAVGNSQDTCWTMSDGGHNHWPTGQQVDIA